MRLLRRGLYEYSPRKLLLAALQGVADVFGVGELEAVSAANQRSFGKCCDFMLRSGYDNFFANLGMTRTDAGFYSCSTPMKDRPLASYTARNRRRAKKRRAIRQQIRSDCIAFLLGVVDRSAHIQSCTENLNPVQHSPNSSAPLDHNRSL